MPEISAIQEELRASKIDGWLFTDLYNRDPISYQVLGLDGHAKRRWFYLVPAKGEPRKLVHRIEALFLDSLPGSKQLYAGLDELHTELPKLLGKSKTLAMQYSPEAAIPVVSTVDAGTVDLVRSFKRKVVSSADLLQKFAARWSPEQFQSHLAAGKVIDRVIQQAFSQAATYVRQGKALTEYDLQQWILEQFRANLLVTDDGPVVAVGPHSGDPHYEPKAGSSAPIREGELMLLDVWGRTRGSNSVYYDITWVGFLGATVPEKYKKVFNVVKQARDAAVNLVTESVKNAKRLEGWQVDKAARDVISKAGYAKYFTHRTGHNIGSEVHGIGANMDGLETRDTRAIIPHTCFSVEPGIYQVEFGIRSEVNVYVADRQARVTGAVQEEILPLLA